MAELKTVRALNYQFRQFLSDHGGWPKDRPTMTWFVNRGYPKDRNQITAMRAGHYVPVKYTDAFIRMLAEKPSTPDLALPHEIFQRFAHERGFPPLAHGDTPVEHLISHACTAVTTSATRREGGRVRSLFADVIQLGLKLMPDYPMEYILDNVARGVSDSYSPRTAARWIYLGLARSRLPNAHRLDEDSAIREATKIIGIDFEEYVRLVEGWARSSPWSVMFARRHRKIVGLSILLPVRESVYAEIRAGKRSTSNIEEQDIQVPSHWLVYEALQEHPELHRHSDVELLEHMRMAIAAQHAAVMRYDPKNEVSRYHFLAVEGTQTNRDRLSAGGFVATPSRSPSSGLPHWEKIADLGTGVNVAPSEEIIVRYLSSLAGVRPRPAEAASGRSLASTT